jgi:hypothetical protein
MKINIDALTKSELIHLSESHFESDVSCFDHFRH